MAPTIVASATSSGTKYDIDSRRLRVALAIATRYISCMLSEPPPGELVNTCACMLPSSPPAGDSGGK